MSDRRWRPVLRGKIFCSPACGGKCTLEAYDKANRDARSLAGRLGKGWMPVVYENLGWHWEVKRGVLEVHRPGYRDYSAWFQGSKQFICHATTPENALFKLKAMVDRFIMTMKEETVDFVPEPRKR